MWGLEVVPSPEERRRRRRQYRTLRVYQRMAQTDHWCDNCCSMIEPGEMYQGRVEIFDGKFMVWKEHVDPKCKPPDEFHDKDDMDADVDVEASGGIAA